MFDWQDGATPLFKAAHKGHVDCVSDLVSHGASLGLLEVSNISIPLYFEDDVFMSGIKLFLL